MIRWTKEEEKYLIENYKCTTYDKISLVLNKSEGAIRAKCFDLGLVKNSRWTSDDVDFLINNYSILTTKEIARQLNRTETAVGIKAKKEGLKKYQYTCDYNFFEIIDTEAKAYWLGFISSDGWISVNSNSGAGVVGIELQVSDINHLKKFNKDIGGNYKIDVIEKQCNLSDHNTPFKMCRIRIYSKKMADDLIKLGVTSSKTENIKLPNLPQDLMRHYIRGFFDGDGCVRQRTRKLASGNECKYPVCDITSKCLDFLNELRTLLYKTKGICSYIYSDKNNTSRLYIHKNQHTLDFLNYIYSDSSVFLTRKYNIYQNITEQANCLAN